MDLPVRTKTERHVASTPSAANVLEETLDCLCEVPSFLAQAAHSQPLGLMRFCSQAGTLAAVCSTRCWRWEIIGSRVRVTSAPISTWVTAARARCGTPPWYGDRETHTHAQTHTCAHAHDIIHTYLHMYTHAYTCTRTQPQERLFGVVDGCDD